MRLFWFGRSLALALLACWVPAAVFAQAVTTPRVVWPAYADGRVSTLAPLTANAANAASFSFGAASNGAIFANGAASMPRAGGGSVPISVVGGIPKAAFGAALGRFLTRAVPIVSTAAAVYQLGEDLGFGVDPADNLLKTKAGYEFHCGLTQCTWTASREAAANQEIGYALGAGWTLQQCDPYPSGTCYAQKPGFSDKYVFLDRREVVPSVQTVESVTAAVESANVSQYSAQAHAIVQQLLANGEALDVTPESITGPASEVVTSSSAANTPSPGLTTNQTVTNNYTYEGVKITTNQTTQNTVVDAGGNVVSVTNVDTSAPETPAEPTPFEMPCGLAGQPACAVKVDETSTPATVTIADPFPQIQADHTEKLDAIKAADGSTWEGIRDFFFLPPAATCVPFDMPVVMGVQVPPLNPCPVVGGIQQVVGVLWAIGAFWVMLGWIREVV